MGIGMRMSTWKSNGNGNQMKRGMGMRQGMKLQLGSVWGYGNGRSNLDFAYFTIMIKYNMYVETFEKLFVK